MTARPLLNPRQRLTVRAVKLMADGALGSRGAALLDDYADEPGNRGLLVTEPDRLYTVTRAASKEQASRPRLRTIGDRANREVLDIFERVEREVRAELRLRDEHAQIVAASDIPQFAKLESSRGSSHPLYFGHAVGATHGSVTPALPKAATRGGS